MLRLGRGFDGVGCGGRAGGNVRMTLNGAFSIILVFAAV